MSQGKQMYYHYLRENIRNMNPKFKELAVRAGAYEDNGTILTGPMDVAKFAELIVKECKSVILDMIDEGQGEFDTLDQALTEINEHFGVEE